MLRSKSELHVSDFKWTLEIIKLSEEDMSKAKIGQKAGLLDQQLAKLWMQKLSF